MDRPRVGLHHGRVFVGVIISIVDVISRQTDSFSSHLRVLLRHAPWWTNNRVVIPPPREKSGTIFIHSQQRVIFFVVDDIRGDNTYCRRMMMDDVVERSTSDAGWWKCWSIILSTTIGKRPATQHVYSVRTMTFVIFYVTDNKTEQQTRTHHVSLRL
jgi:hypothetical protein